MRPGWLHVRPQVLQARPDVRRRVSLRQPMNKYKVVYNAYTERIDSCTWCSGYLTERYDIPNINVYEKYSEHKWFVN